jgi:hypothetical protein
VRQSTAVADAFHTAWDQVQLPADTYASSLAFFTWTDVPMAYSCLLSAKEEARPQLGFVMMRIHSLDGGSRYSMERIFYQVQPVRQIIVLERRERGFDV